MNALPASALHRTAAMLPRSVWVAICTGPLLSASQRSLYGRLCVSPRRSVSPYPPLT